MKLLEQLQQLAPLAAQATAAPWSPTTYFDQEDNQEYPAGGVEQVGPDMVLVCGDNFEHEYAIMTTADTAFIAAARNLLTPENLTLIIGLLSNMESGFETNRVLAHRQLDIQGILETDLLDDTKLYLISETINPPKIAKR